MFENSIYLLIFLLTIYPSYDHLPSGRSWREEEFVHLVCKKKILLSIEQSWFLFSLIGLVAAFVDRISARKMIAVVDAVPPLALSLSLLPFLSLSLSLTLPSSNPHLYSPVIRI